MKAKFFYSLFAILIFSKKSYSQAINYNELIGVWKCGSGKYYDIWTFKSDTIYSQNSIYKMNIWSYKFDSLNNEYFLETLPLASKYTPCTYYKLKQITKDSLTLQIYKIRAFSTKTNDWYEFDPHNHKIIQPLTRITNN
jgi:hypothetical protein